MELVAFIRIAPSASRSPKAAVSVTEPTSACAALVAFMTISSPACSTTLPPVERTVIPALIVRSSANAGPSAVSPAVKVRVPALVTLAAMVSGLAALTVVVVPVFVDTALIVNAPVLRMFTALVVFVKFTLLTVESRSMPVPAVRFNVGLLTLLAAALPSTMAPAAFSVTALPAVVALTSPVSVRSLAAVARPTLPPVEVTPLVVLPNTVMLAVVSAPALVAKTSPAALATRFVTLVLNGSPAVPKPPVPAEALRLPAVTFTLVPLSVIAPNA